MRKIDKAISIAVVLMMVGVCLGQNVYALRLPIGKQDDTLIRIVGSIKRTEFLAEVANDVFIDPVMKAIRQAGIYKTFDLKDVETIQIRVTSTKKDITKIKQAPEVNIKNKSLVFFVSSDRLSQYRAIKWELCQSVLALWRETNTIEPLELEWTHINPEVQSLFDAVRERLEIVGGWRVKEWIEGIGPDGLSGGASWILKLQEPTKTHGKMHRALKIKRVTAHGVLPPQQKVHLEALRVDLDEANKLVLLDGAPTSEGGIFWSAALNEFREGQSWIQDNVSLESNIPIAVARYKNMTFQGKPLGFIVFAEIDPEDLRQEEVILQEIRTRHERGPTLDDAVEIAQHLIAAAGLLGSTVRGVNSAGRYWEIATLDNMTPSGGVRDRDNMKKIANLSVERRIGYRLLDLIEAVRHFRALPERLGDSALGDAMIKPMTQAFLQRYFAKELKGMPLENAFEDLVYILEEGESTPVHELDNQIAHLMHSAVIADETQPGQKEPDRSDELVEASEALSIIAEHLRAGEIVIFGDMHRGERTPQDDEIWDRELFLNYVEQLGELSMNFSVALELPHQLEDKLNDPSVSVEDFLDEYYKLLSAKNSVKLAKANREIRGPYLSRLLNTLKRFNIPVILIDDINSQRGGLGADIDVIEQSNRDMAQKLLEGRKKYSNDSVLLMVGRNHVVSKISSIWLGGDDMNSIPEVLRESETIVKLVRPDDFQYDKEDLAKFDLIIKVDRQALDSLKENLGGATSIKQLLEGFSSRNGT